VKAPNIETNEPGATGRVPPFPSTAKLAALVTPPLDTNTSAPVVTVRLTDRRALPPALSITPTRNVDVPGTVGVPVMVPELRRVKPFGIAPCTRTQL
jgi:hypothetical protein